MIWSRLWMRLCGRERASSHNYRQANDAQERNAKAEDEHFKRFSLLEAMMIQAGCESPDELRNLEEPQRNRLAHALRSIVEKPDQIQDWNDALTCLSDDPPQKTAAAAKERLISILTKE